MFVIIGIIPPRNVIHKTKQIVPPEAASKRFSRNALKIKALHITVFIEH